MVDTVYGGSARSHIAAASGDAHVRADTSCLPWIILRLQAGAATSGVLMFFMSNYYSMGADAERKSFLFLAIEMEASTVVGRGDSGEGGEELAH